MKNTIRVTLVASVLLASLSIFAVDRTPSKAGATVYIISPANGEVVANSFKVQFGLSGMGIAPATVDKSNTGHHHLIVDGHIDTINKNLPIGAQAMHFGAGQTETVLTLPAGKHTLQLLLADKFHIPHQPVVMSEKITIFVR